jgi:hypothetical protein
MRSRSVSWHSLQLGTTRYAVPATRRSLPSRGYVASTGHEPPGTYTPPEPVGWQRAICRTSGSGLSATARAPARAANNSVLPLTSTALAATFREVCRHGRPG